MQKLEEKERSDSYNELTRLDTWGSNQRYVCLWSDFDGFNYSAH